MANSIVIIDGARRLPRADILINNREPGLLSRFSTTQLGGKAIAATLEHSNVDKEKVGHVVMGMAQHSHRDSIYAAKGMAWRGGLPQDVPALTVARICGSGAEAIAVGAEMILAGVRHDAERPFLVVGGAESMQYPFCLYNQRGKKMGAAVQKYGPIDGKALPPGTHLQDMLLMSLYDPSAKMTMANTAEELALRYLSQDERLEVARYIFPLVYNRGGIIADGDRRRFARVCTRLQLEDAAAKEISQAYRQRLDGQWAYMRQLVDFINHFADHLAFDGREMELVREQLDQLMRFDPRRTGTSRRERLLNKLGHKSPKLPADLENPDAEAALMGAYAMAHTAVPAIEDRTVLEKTFDELLTDHNITAAKGKSLVATRKKIDKLYTATREQILSAEKADRQTRQTQKKTGKKPTT